MSIALIEGLDALAFINVVRMQGYPMNVSEWPVHEPV